MNNVSLVTSESAATSIIQSANEVAVASAPLAATAAAILDPRCNNTPTNVSLSPGHKAIMDMHAESQNNAVLYVVVVLALYAAALLILMFKYVKTERYEARLSNLYNEFVRRERFLRLSKRRVSGGPSNMNTPAPSVVTCEDDDRSPTSTRRPSNLIEIESQV